MKLDTTSALLISYQTPTPLLTTVAEHYLPHLSKGELYRYAARGKLPFPAFKIDNSRKAPYYVHVSALAKWIDKQSAQAEIDYNNMA